MGKVLVIAIVCVALLVGLCAYEVIKEKRGNREDE